MIWKSKKKEFRDGFQNNRLFDKKTDQKQTKNRPIFSKSLLTDQSLLKQTELTPLPHTPPNVFHGKYFQPFNSSTLFQ